jgi:hypothetical protein
LAELRDNPSALLLANKHHSPRAFTIMAMKEMGTKRSGVSGSFIGEATELLLSFYRTVVQGLRPYAMPPAKLPEDRGPLDAASQPENVVEQSAEIEAEEASTRSLPVD